MIGQTEHGHSFLQFSNQLALLMINFDELYWEDRDQCFAYAHEKITRLKTALEMIGARVRHLGVISQRVMPEIVQPLSMLRDQIVKIETDLLVSNIATKIAVICENQYFVNIEMSNLPFRDESGQREALSVIVDINDKYGVDSKGGQSSLDRLSKILDLQKHISDEMINNLLRTGRLALYDA